MALSNTAVPKYYGAFRERVKAGIEPVCFEIAQQMARIDAKIEDPRYYYDDKAIDGYIRFCENELTLVNGEDMFLLDTFKLWAEDLLSWYYFAEESVYERGPDGQGVWVTKVRKKRLTVKQVLLVGRGAAKSIYLETIQAYFLTVIPETTHQVTTAPTMRQADEVLSPFRTAITRARGPLFKLMTTNETKNQMTRGHRLKLVSTKKGIENQATNSLLEIRPMAIDKLQGLRNKVSTVDEIFSGDTREDPIAALEQGASKLDDYIIIAASSEGTYRNGVGDTVKIELKKVLNCEIEQDHVSIFWYKLDDIKEVGMPEMWIKAQPNLGKTVTYETYHRDVARAEESPANKNDILAKRFGLPMEGFTFYFTYEETLTTATSLNFSGMDCAVGVDLSQGDDFCAFVFEFELGGHLVGLKARCYITERAYQNATTAVKLKYDEFIKEGSLIIMDGTKLDSEQVFEDLVGYIHSQKYNPITMGYDPYESELFVKRWIQEFGPRGVEKVAQGKRNETVPLGDIKHDVEDRNVMFDQKIASFCFGNAIVLVSTDGGRKLVKRKAEAKIDVVSAWICQRVGKKRNGELY